jgi:hypothetical protein
LTKDMKCFSNYRATASRDSNSRGHRICAAIATLLLSLCSATSQGTFTVTLDGPPLQAPGTARIVQSYSESSVWFAPIPGSEYGFVRRGSNPIPGWPNDGTAYVQAGGGSTLMLGLDGGSSFDPVSVDLAEYSDIVRDPVTVHFVGYRQDGTVLTDDITTAGVFNGIAPVFQTFTFDSGFSGLVRVEIPYSLWSLDNLTLRHSVPEPGTGALLGVGAALLGIRRSRGTRSGCCLRMSPLAQAATRSHCPPPERFLFAAIPTYDDTPTSISHDFTL